MLMVSPRPFDDHVAVKKLVIHVVGFEIILHGDTGGEPVFELDVDDVALGTLKVDDLDGGGGFFRAGSKAKDHYKSQ